MEILLYKDILLNFISQEIEKKHLKQIKQILENENSIFLYSKKYIQFLKNEVREEDEQIFMDLFRKIADNNTSIKNLDTTTTNFDEEYLSINLQSQNNILIKLAYDIPSIEIKTKISNIAILKNQLKPNYHWLVVDLAISHPRKVTVNCFDFKSNLEITNFFNDIYKLSNKIKIINIFDTQCNFSHDKFDFLKVAKSRICYYTKFSSSEKNQFDRKDEIKSNFGASSKVFLTLPRKKAHGRRIIFENIIIACDEDFWNLEINSSDWCIDVQYSKEDTIKWLSRCVNYQEFR